MFICKDFFSYIMKKGNLELNLNFNEIRKRIELDKNQYKPGAWANKVGVSVNVVSNIHGKTQQKPSLEYIIAVSIATGKSVDYYLWGKGQEQNNQMDYYYSDAQKIITEHQALIKRFKDPKVGKDANKWLIDIQDSDSYLFAKAINIIKKIWITAKVIKDVESESYPEPNMENLDRELDPEKYEKELNEAKTKRREGGMKNRRTGTREE